MAQRHIQIAEIQAKPALHEQYKAAAQEQIDDAIRLEPGVLVLYSMSNKDNPTHITTFEIYRDRDAYIAHLQAPHFMKYKATVENMAQSLRLISVDPIALKAKEGQIEGSSINAMSRSAKRDWILIARPQVGDSQQAPETPVWFWSRALRLRSSGRQLLGRRSIARVLPPPLDRSRCLLPYRCRSTGARTASVRLEASNRCTWRRWSSTYKH